MTTPSEHPPASLKPLTWYKELATKKGRVEAGAFLVEGERSVELIAASYPDQILEIITTKKLPSTFQAYATRSLTENQFRSICASRTPQGTMALIRLPFDLYSHRLPEDSGNKILVLEDIQDPGNVGTPIRTAGPSISPASSLPPAVPIRWAQSACSQVPAAYCPFGCEGRPGT